MITHVKTNQIKERYKYNTYWKMHLPMLLNTIKKGFAQQNIKTNNKSAVGQIVKNAYERVAHLAWERGGTKSTTL